MQEGPPHCRDGPLHLLEVVLDGELHRPRVGPDRRTLVTDVAETRRGYVGDVGPRIAEKRVVEQVVCVGAEVDLLLMPDGEVLGDRGSISLEAGGTLSAYAGGTEGTECRLGVCALTIVGGVSFRIKQTWYCRRIGSEPVVDRTIDYLQRSQLVRTLGATINLRVVGCGHGDREAGVGDAGHAYLPSAYDLVHKERHTGTILASAT